MVALLWLGISLAAHAQTTVEYIHTDALGTPIAVTDANKVVIETTEYEPYGAQVAGPVKDGPGYTGHVQDMATGLTYMQQRYYDPDVGRMLSVDPVTAHQQPLANFCRYCYARNNPYTFADPDGKDAIYFQDVRVLVIPVYFSGTGATGDNISAISNLMKAVQSDWGGMKVRLQVLQSPGGFGTNRMSLAPVDDFRNYPKAGEGANDFGGNRAHINTSKSGWVGAAVHDLLHLAGAQEGYEDEGWRGGRTSAPKPGYTNDHIMADRSGTRLSGGDVDNIIRNDTTIKTNLSEFRGVFRVESRLDSKKLDKELSK
ncbi:RHS repeat-associated core domain-containing protein [Pseudoxanthomonas sp. LARHCG66]